MTPLPSPVRVFAIDDHPAFLATLGLVVEATEGFELAGTAGSGIDALEMLIISTIDPDSAVAGSDVDLILVDVVMDAMSGPEFCRRYRAADGTAHLVLMSSYDPADLTLFERGNGSPIPFVTKSALHSSGLVDVWQQVATGTGC